MDFAWPKEVMEVRDRVRAFMEHEVLPHEAHVIAEDRSFEYATLHLLQEKARREGLFVPQLSKELGGLGLGFVATSALFREMGRSLVGARVFNADAPDQGNMDLLASTASPAQKEKYLMPLIRGEVSSAFCMTEPAPGAGSDPNNLSTRATKTKDGFVLSGHKWFSTGGGRASFLIVMARTSDDPRSGATMFLVDRESPGVEHVRDVETMGPPLLAHREAEFRFHDVRLSFDAVLGEVGEGFRLAQKRLVPARLTHCMRWLGLADRALAMCRPYLQTRRSFGAVLADHQMVQQKIAANASAIHAGNLMTLHCAWMLEQGRAKEARVYSSMAKTHVAQSLLRLLDDAIQLHGALGISRDMPFSEWYSHARAARIVDGADEVHTFLIAREYMTGQAELLW